MELVLVDRYDVLGIGIQWEVWGGEGVRIYSIEMYSLMLALYIYDSMLELQFIENLTL